jgi:outer membrane protein OmpA-like peptidoglycan-associated protein
LALKSILLLAAATVALGLPACVAPGPAVYMEGQRADLQRRLAGTGVDILLQRAQSPQRDQMALRMPGDIVFAVDRAEVAPRFGPVLDSLAQSLIAYPDTVVEVVGFADASGSVAHNQLLSEDRAAAVAAYLAGRSVRASRLSVSGRGEREPIASNDTPEGRALNRRVEVILRPLNASADGPPGPWRRDTEVSQATMAPAPLR